MRKRQGFVLVAGVLLALVTGCASGDGGDDKIASINSPQKSGEPGADQAANQGTDEDKMRAFAKCMRENGVDMPDPQVGPDGKGNGIAIGPADDGKEVDMKKMEAASETCRKLLPNGGEMKPIDPAQLDKMRKDAKCMREHGVDMPDPGETGRGTMSRTDAPDEAKMKEAMKACGLGDGMLAVPAVPAG
jgi:hypothetical protein